MNPEGEAGAPKEPLDAISDRLAGRGSFETFFGQRSLSWSCRCEEGKSTQQEPDEQETKDAKNITPTCRSR